MGNLTALDTLNLGSYSGDVPAELVELSTKSDSILTIYNGNLTIYSGRGR